MQEAMEVDRAPLVAHRSPVDNSTEPSRHGSGRTALPARSSDVPPSPRTRLARRRAASLDIDSANKLHSMADVTLDSAITPTPQTGDPTQVCLCQPDPKIPRPRNAFILYRQHHQAQVVAQNPKLPNPEISKIIGVQWREQPLEVKAEWRRLAEEEKERHKRQYPGYRYQPRRSAKGSGIRPVSASSSEDQIRCPKCNGRYISTPGTPMSPFPSGITSAHPDRLQPPFTPPRSLEDSRNQYSTPMQNQRMGSPRGPPQQMHILSRPYERERERLHAHDELDEDDVRMQSPGPDHKRRRSNQDSFGYNDHHRNYAQSPATYSASPRYVRNPSLPMSASYRQQRFPPPVGMLVRPGTGTMGPPPQHSSMSQTPRVQYTPQSATFDESLRLPPLQTHLSNSSGSSHRADPKNAMREEQARSVEAMVMTIPFANKIKLLASVSPPLADPGPTSPAVETRGAMIVLEGSDQELLTEVGTFIEEHLQQDQTCAVKTWEGPSIASTRSPASDPKEKQDVEMTTSEEEKDPYSEYLSNISSWHTKSRQIIKHITTLPPTNESESSDVVRPNIKPIALVPGGFSLTTSDQFALKIPINDAYSAVDHWQWMATLWRGIIGPDLIIYIQRVGRDEMFGVEIRKDCAAIVVRVAEGKMVERTSRRLAFEVMEFVRNFEPGKSDMAARN